MTRNTPRRLMILQFLQIFRTDALTFISSFPQSFLRLAAISLEIRLLHQALVLVRHHVRMQT